MYFEERENAVKEQHHYDIDFDYLARVRALVTLSSKRRSMNILEGDYVSVYKGRSKEFDELKEYTPGDNVRDIDWRASARSRDILVRRFVAERKHNLLFIGDTGKKMEGHTESGAEKAKLMLLTFGSIAYLADRLGADYALLHSRGAYHDLSLFRSGNTHLESLMRDYAAQMTTEPAHDLKDLMLFAADNIAKRMIAVVLTDMQGLTLLDDRLLERVRLRHDLMLVQIDDAYLTGNNRFDAGAGKYASDMLISTGRLQKAEQRYRKELEAKTKELFRTHRVPMIRVGAEQEVTEKILQLFQEAQRM